MLIQLDLGAMQDPASQLFSRNLPSHKEELPRRQCNPRAGSTSLAA